MPRPLFPAILACAAGLSAQTAFFPLKDIRPGMHGTGRTVFQGSRVEDFQVEILGVLENVGPKESLILGRLSGGPLEHTGVMQGMSGSPVYIDGKLAGAVAMAFPFAKDPIAGIRPIEDMVRASTAPVLPSGSVPAGQRVAPPGKALAFGEKDLTRRIPRPEAVVFSGPTADSRMIEIATPMSFGGFSRATLEAFAPQLRTLGLEPRQGITAGARIEGPMGNPADLKPGSMISVQLMAGDLSVGADGTVTYIDGNRLYAFGHRFLAVGATDLPFAKSDVITLLANTNTSFKLSTAREWMGSISQDHDTAVAGELGRRASMVPVSIDVAHNSKRTESYQMQMVDDPLLSPLLVQMAVFSTIDATQRTVGASSIRVSGEFEFQNSPAAVKLNNMFSGDNGSAMQVSLSAAVPVAYVLQSGFDSLRLKRVALRVDASDRKKQVNIDALTVSRHEVRPGDKVTLTVVLAGDNGAETRYPVDYQVPIGAEPGTLYFTVADGNTTNLADFRQILGVNPHSAAQLISTVNNLHPNTKAYVRVWRADPAYQLEGADLPDPPASVALILAGSQSSLAGVTQTRNSKIGEMEIDAGDQVVNGAKTVQVEIKE